MMHEYGSTSKAVAERRHIDMRKALEQRLDFRETASTRWPGVLRAMEPHKAMRRTTSPR